MKFLEKSPRRLVNVVTTQRAGGKLTHYLTNLSIGHVQFLCQFNCVAEVVLNGTLIITKLTEDTLFSTFKFANCSRNLMLDLSLEEPIRDYSVRAEFKKIA